MYPSGYSAGFSFPRPHGCSITGHSRRPIDSQQSWRAGCYYSWWNGGLTSSSILLSQSLRQLPYIIVIIPALINRSHKSKPSLSEGAHLHLTILQIEHTTGRVRTVNTGLAFQYKKQKRLRVKNFRDGHEHGVHEPSHERLWTLVYERKVHELSHEHVNLFRTFDTKNRYGHARPFSFTWIYLLCASSLTSNDKIVWSFQGMSDAPPIIDWSIDADVMQIGKVTDAQALTQGWCDAKVAGTLFFP